MELETWFENRVALLSAVWIPHPLHRRLRTRRAATPGRQSWVLRLRCWLFDAKHDWECLICATRDKIQETRRGREKLKEDPDIHTTIDDRSRIA